ncbi:MAG: hypothetical protein V3T02_08830, partial [Alphaproteobacteria bacterium]
SVTELAERHGVDRTDIGRLVPLAFLAPDIVEAILERRKEVPWRHPSGGFSHRTCGWMPPTDF